jgi:LETM1 and EF-hand domain-containing protein 1|uniref:Letm1 RBD domain-containing protein n=1 Tax=Panagrolaimus sp. PS1159 TaxID=55785 RepID=A0AC35GWG6_9BILA
MKSLKLCRPFIIHCYRTNILQQRSLAPLFYTRNVSNDDGKRVQEMLRILKEDLKQQKKDDEEQLALVPTEPQVKLPIRTRVLNELKHYYHGFRLLALEIKVSAKYAWMIFKGKTLTRLERQQLVRTLADVFRLVPFSVFIIVPFMEFALPIFIKLFPNMLPSTFQEKSKEQEKFRKQLKMRMETAKFLQDTLEELAEKRPSSDGAEKQDAYEFSKFMKKVRSEGSYVSNQELLKFTKLFEDELTLDNLPFPQLRALCRILGVSTIGPPELLRFQLLMKLRDLKNDDRMIAEEGGVEALSVADCQQACRARGMRFLGVSEERLRNQLKSWLEMSLNDNIPPSLLLLSRAFYLPEELTFNERLKTILALMPTNISEQTRQKLTELQGGKVSYKERMDLIMNIEESLQAERVAEENTKKKKEQLAKEKAEADGAESDKDKKAENAEEKEKVQQKRDIAEKIKEVIEEAKEELQIELKDKALEEASTSSKEKPTTAEAVLKRALKRTEVSAKTAHEKLQEEIEKVSMMSAEEREALTNLKNKIRDLAEDQKMQPNADGDDKPSKEVQKKL